ncbi:ABC transporter substrate-binding protein [Isoptericola cucumis]|uniref:Sugar ABC transporter substrate-binding protein n=1 Tax=Isoptericola cucumis TaxID=1776856 RepID=A0ABQ2B8J8_9MICO|nr:sugar ABC transporter substrate-binding protein [Isoptericola cucumis]GGI10336.1 sugar ABC transporter substrate-binding protein [Isoptericola cucumis]
MKHLMRSASLAGVAAVALALTACSGGGDDAGDSATVAATDAQAEITYAIWDENQKPAIDQNIKDFNKKYPNIKVTVDLTPYQQYFTKLQTQGESKTLPDVFWMNGPNVQLYAANDLLQPVTGLVDSGDLDPSKYPDALNELYTFEEEQYGVPKDFDTVALWYNKALFADAGVDVPTDEWTWDDFSEAANTISDKLSDKGVYGVVTELNSAGQSSYYDTILQAGGFMISDDGTTSGYDEPESIEGLQFWADLVESGASPSLQQLSDTKPNIWFNSGKAAMFTSGNWSVAEMKDSKHKDDFGIVRLPKGPEQRATVIHGVANVVAADSENQAAANAFLSYLGSEEAQRTQAEMGVANPAYDGTQEAFVDSVPSFGIEVFLESADEMAFPYPISKNTAAWNALENELLPQAFSGERPVEEVAKELATAMDEELAKE